MEYNILMAYNILLLFGSQKLNEEIVALQQDPVRCTRSAFVSFNTLQTASMCAQVWLVQGDDYIVRGLVYRYFLNSYFRPVTQPQFLKWLFREPRMFRRLSGRT